MAAVHPRSRCPARTHRRSGPESPRPLDIDLSCASPRMSRLQPPRTAREVHLTRFHTEPSRFQARAAARLTLRAGVPGASISREIPATRADAARGAMAVQVAGLESLVGTT